MAIASRRSKKSHMRVPRIVTEAPTGMPSRTLKLAMDLRERFSFGFCPVMSAAHPWRSRSDFGPGPLRPHPC